MSIRLSKKHGLNPAIATCFWCGKDMGVALFGALKGDKEAPRRVCLGLEPCNECKENFKKGVQIIEVSEDGSRFDGRRDFSIRAEGGAVVYPTGRHVVVKAEAIRGGKAGAKMLADKATMDAILKKFGAAKNEEKASD